MNINHVVNAGLVVALLGTAPPLAAADPKAPLKSEPSVWGLTAEEINTQSWDTLLSRAGFPENFKKAKAAAKKDPLARALVAIATWKGIGAKRHPGRACDDAKQSAEDGNALGMFVNATCYESGAKQDRWDFNGTRFFDDVDYTLVLTWHRKASELGHLPAQVALGRLYLFGLGVPENREHGLKLVRTAAERGVVNAWVLMGDLYRTGRGVERYPDVAAECYRNAAMQGDPSGMHKLGMSYYNGQGVAKNYDEAATWWRKAAELNHAKSQVALGEMYQFGVGVVGDYAEAARWYQKAVDLDEPRASARLGRLYRDGLGVKENGRKAYNLWWDAAYKGDGLANLELAIDLTVTHGKVHKHGLDNALAATTGANDLQYDGVNGSVLAHYLSAIQYQHRGEMTHAVEHLTKAANAGYPKAQQLLPEYTRQAADLRAAQAASVAQAETEDTSKKSGGMFGALMGAALGGGVPGVPSVGGLGANLGLTGDAAEVADIVGVSMQAALAAAGADPESGVPANLAGLPGLAGIQGLGVPGVSSIAGQLGLTGEAAEFANLMQATIQTAVAVEAAEQAAEKKAAAAPVAPARSANAAPTASAAASAPQAPVAGAAPGAGAVIPGSYKARPNILNGQEACIGYSIDNYKVYYAANSKGPDAQLHALCAGAFNYYWMYLNAIRQGYSQADSDKTYGVFKASAETAIRFYATAR
jgi:TPR repeat protein